MAGLVSADRFDQFRQMRDVSVTDLAPALIEHVKRLDERDELEPMLRLILADEAQTPHGPAEITDIFTHRLTLDNDNGMAAFILKGKSFQTVRPVDVAHQIYRLEKIDGLAFALFVAAGVVLDAAKEQFCSTCERIGVSYAFVNATELAQLFVAAGFLCPRDGSRLTSGRCTCGYSPPNREPNLLQQDALKNLERSREIGNRAGLVVLPPGSGKTRVAAEDAKIVNANRVLYIAHTAEILDVAQSEFEAVFGASQVGWINGRGGSTDLANVTLATVQYLSRHIDEFAPETFDYVVVDEFHHSPAPSYRRILDRLTPKFLLGLTATPFREDRQDIWQLCGNNTIVSYELRNGIESGVLVPYHYFGCIDQVDYSKVEVQSGRFSLRDLERILVIPERDAAIIAKWKEMAEQRKTLAFCCTIKHAERAAENFTQAGIPAAAYTSAMSRQQRDTILTRFRSGDLKVLAVVDVLNEGADLPFVECLLFMRPTESKRIFFQQLGRGLRRFTGKSYCLVIDFIGNFRNASRIPEYQGLTPSIDDVGGTGCATRSSRDVLNLPLGCTVTFDDRVIDLFTRELLDPAHANRHNIARILILEYEKLGRYLKRAPRKADVDRLSILGSNLYALVFGSWRAFEKTFAPTIKP